MLANYFNTTVIAEWIALIAAVIFLKKDKGLWNLFIPVLLFIIFTETSGWYQINILDKTTNPVPFNIQLIILRVFYIWFLANAGPFTRYKKQLYIILITFLVLAMINLYFVQGFEKYNSLTESAGDLLLAFIASYFLYTITKDDEFVSLIEYEYFWLAAGLLFYSLGSAVMYIFLDQLQEFKNKTHINIFVYLTNTNSILLYGNLIVAFICRWKITS